MQCRVSLTIHQPITTVNLKSKLVLVHQLKSKFKEYKEELRRDCPNTSKFEPESRLELWKFEFNCSNMCVPQQQDTSASDGCSH